MNPRIVSNRYLLIALLFALLSILAAALPTAVAAAAEEVAAEQPAAESILTGFTQKSAAKSFTATLEFVGAPRSRLLLLRHPDRVAIDLFDTVSALGSMIVEPNDMVADVRQGLVAADRYRIVFSLKQPGLPQADLKTVDGKTRLTLSVAAADAARFAAAAASQPIGATPAAAAAPEPSGTFTVVLDPGHGGVDTGALGKHGTLEKDINLQVGKALRDALAKQPGVTVLMTREDDRFITLSERSEIARRAKADLFISLHADSIRYAALRGATVYTLSGKASDQLSREVAESENAADRFVDPEWQESQPAVFNILVELMRRETDSFSQHFAAGLVQEFGRHKVRLIRNPKRSAGFKVLMAPDVPSVLVELGYLSNDDDEQLLLDPSWRNDTAAAIAAAVTGFLGSRPAATEIGGG